MADSAVRRRALKSFLFLETKPLPTRPPPTYPTPFLSHNKPTAFLSTVYVTRKFRKLINDEVFRYSFWQRSYFFVTYPRQDVGLRLEIDVWRWSDRFFFSFVFVLNVVSVIRCEYLGTGYKNDRVAEPVCGILIGTVHLKIRKTNLRLLRCFGTWN